MRLIDADKLSNNIYENVPAPYEDSREAKEECLRIIEEALTIDAVPIVHGRWMDNEDYMFCSCCGMQWNYCDNDTEDFHYCPYCGAKMNGGECSE